MVSLFKVSNRSHQPFLKMFGIFFVAIISIFYVESGYALDLNAATMITNFTKSIPNLMRLITALAYVMGMAFIIKGLFELKKYGEQRSMSHSEASILKGAIISISVGAALLYLPTSVQVGFSTFWTNETPLAYIPEGGDPWSDLINDCLLIIQLIGTIAFIRGLVIMSTLGGSAQHGTFAKGLTHIIAGILCINMYAFVKVVMNTLSLGQV